MVGDGTKASSECSLQYMWNLATLDNGAVDDEKIAGRPTEVAQIIATLKENGISNYMAVRAWHILNDATKVFRELTGLPIDDPKYEALAFDESKALSQSPEFRRLCQNLEAYEILIDDLQKEIAASTADKPARTKDLEEMQERLKSAELVKQKIVNAQKNLHAATLIYNAVEQGIRDQGGWNTFIATTNDHKNRER